MAKKNDSSIEVKELLHSDAKRKNIPAQEMQPVMNEKDKRPVEFDIKKRNPDLDPQLVWRGKYDGDDELKVQAMPLFIQEKVKPKVLIDDLKAMSKKKKEDNQLLLFADYDGITDEDAKTEFYQHDCNWQNRMILGDSLQVMTSLAVKEGLAGQVQCIYFDPPYGIKFNSNFQWSTTTTNVKDGNAEHITREPEQVKAFRDTWKDGVHTYLSYLRDRLLVARELLAESGSVFVQIGDENVHRVRAMMDEVFGEENFVSQISVEKTSGTSTITLSSLNDYVIWYCKNIKDVKYRQLYLNKELGHEGATQYVWYENNGIDERITDFEHLPTCCKVFAADNCTSMGKANTEQPFDYFGRTFYPSSNAHWKPTYPEGMQTLGKANRFKVIGNSLMYRRYFNDFPVIPISNIWNDTKMTGFTEKKVYIVQTSISTIERCLLMTSDPGDLVLDPTCGSGTTAYVSEQWGRRWITIDTSRVALALARARIMGARFPYYLLADSKEGQQKEAEITHTFPKSTPTGGNVKYGFVYERVPHITLKSIANNVEIDVIYDKFQEQMEPLRKDLNEAVSKSYEEWEIPREADPKWSAKAKELHAEWWKLRLARQKEIDASIAAKAEFEFLYDKPYTDNKKVRVAGPFTVESLDPHRYISVDENENPILNPPDEEDDGTSRFVTMIMETLKAAGIQQAHKEDRINFSSVEPWAGTYICSEGRYEQNGKEMRAGIFIGPEFGTARRADLVEAAREAAEAGFDVLITCAFNYDASSTELNKLGHIHILKARMNADLHMAGDLKNTGNGNLFVIFGEPDIQIINAPNNQIQVKILGVDVYHPNSGEVLSDGPEGIACWFIDSDYNEESFFVRQAYFLGANDPYAALKTSLKAEINQDAWESLHSDISRPFDKPSTGRIAVKVINHLGDEVLKVFKID